MLVLGAGSRSGRPPLSPVASVVPSGRTSTPPALALGGEAERNRVEKLVGKLAGARMFFCGLVFGMLNAAVEVAETPLGDRGGMGGNCDSVDETCHVSSASCGAQLDDLRQPTSTHTHSTQHMVL